MPLTPSLVISSVGIPQHAMRSTAFLLLTLCILASLAVAPAGAQQTAPKIAALLQDYARTGGFSGTVLVAEHGNVVYAGGAGAANYEQHSANTPDTPYPICSITKQMTAVLVLQQAAAGTLKLDTPVSDILPDFPAPGRAVTVEQILTHTSGLPNMDDFLPDGGFYARTDKPSASPSL